MKALGEWSPTKRKPRVNSSKRHSTFRDQRIPEKMEDGTNLLARGWTDMAQERERGVMGDLEQLASMIREAERALGSGTEETPRERLQRALNQVGIPGGKSRVPGRPRLGQRSGKPGSRATARAAGRTATGRTAWTAGTAARTTTGRTAWTARAAAGTTAGTAGLRVGPGQSISQRCLASSRKESQH